MNYFSIFPTINYTLAEISGDTSIPISRPVPNMTARVRLENFDLDMEQVSYQTYRIQDGERPDVVSTKFYSSSEFVWVIFLANNMRDWYDWPMGNIEFDNYMAKKYESAPGANDGVSRSQNQLTPLPDTQYLRLIGAEEYFVNRETYLGLSPSQRRLITVYQQEEQENVRRQEIRLLDLAAVRSIQEQLVRVMRA
jgi:hypothetical protein